MRILKKFNKQYWLFQKPMLSWIHNIGFYKTDVVFEHQHWFSLKQPMLVSIKQHRFSVKIDVDYHNITSIYNIGFYWKLMLYVYINIGFTKNWCCRYTFDLYIFHFQFLLFLTIEHCRNLPFGRRASETQRCVFQ